MLVFLTNRILQTFIVLLAMSLLVFASVYAIGNPIDVLINPEASEAEKIKTIKGLGLDKSLIEQYYIFLKNAFKGELGYSFVHNRPAISLILERLPATLELTIFALLIAIIIGIPLGVIAGLNPNNFISKLNENFKYDNYFFFTGAYSRDELSNNLYINICKIILCEYLIDNKFNITEDIFIVSI